MCAGLQCSVFVALKIPFPFEGGSAGRGRGSFGAHRLPLQRGSLPTEGTSQQQKQQKMKDSARNGPQEVHLPSDEDHGNDICPTAQRSGASEQAEAPLVPVVKCQPVCALAKEPSQLVPLCMETEVSLPDSPVEVCVVGKVLQTNDNDEKVDSEEDNVNAEEEKVESEFGPQNGILDTSTHPSKKVETRGSMTENSECEEKCRVETKNKDLLYRPEQSVSVFRSPSSEDDENADVKSVFNLESREASDEGFYSVFSADPDGRSRKDREAGNNSTEHDSAWQVLSEAIDGTVHKLAHTTPKRPGDSECRDGQGTRSCIAPSIIDEQNEYMQRSPEKVCQRSLTPGKKAKMRPNVSVTSPLETCDRYTPPSPTPSTASTVNLTPEVDMCETEQAPPATPNQATSIWSLKRSDIPASESMLFDSCDQSGNPSEKNEPAWEAVSYTSFDSSKFSRIEERNAFPSVNVTKSSEAFEVGGGFGDSSNPHLLDGTHQTNVSKNTCCEEAERETPTSDRNEFPTERPSESSSFEAMECDSAEAENNQGKTNDPYETTQSAPRDWQIHYALKQMSPEIDADTICSSNDLFDSTDGPRNTSSGDAQPAKTTTSVGGSSSLDLFAPSPPKLSAKLTCQRSEIENQKHLEKSDQGPAHKSTGDLVIPDLSETGGSPPVNKPATPNCADHQNEQSSGFVTSSAALFSPEGESSSNGGDGGVAMAEESNCEAKGQEIQQPPPTKTVPDTDLRAPRVLEPCDSESNGEIIRLIFDHPIAAKSPSQQANQTDGSAQPTVFPVVLPGGSQSGEVNDSDVQNKRADESRRPNAQAMETEHDGDLGSKPLGISDDPPRLTSPELEKTVEFDPDGQCGADVETEDDTSRSGASEVEGTVGGNTGEVENLTARSSDSQDSDSAIAVDLNQANAPEGVVNADDNQGDVAQISSSDGLLGSLAAKDPNYYSVESDFVEEMKNVDHSRQDTEKTEQGASESHVTTDRGTVGGTSKFGTPPSTDGCEVPTLGRSVFLTDALRERNPEHSLAEGRDGKRSIDAETSANKATQSHPDSMTNDPQLFGVETGHSAEERGMDGEDATQGNYPMDGHIKSGGENGGQRTSPELPLAQGLMNVPYQQQQQQKQCPDCYQTGNPEDNMTNGMCVGPVQIEANELQVLPPGASAGAWANFSEEINPDSPPQTSVPSSEKDLLPPFAVSQRREEAGASVMFKGDQSCARDVACAVLQSFAFGPPGLDQFFGSPEDLVIVTSPECSGDAQILAEEDTAGPPPVEVQIEPDRDDSHQDPAVPARAELDFDECFPDSGISNSSNSVDGEMILYRLDIPQPTPVAERGVDAPPEVQALSLVGNPTPRSPQSPQMVADVPVGLFEPRGNGRLGSEMSDSETEIKQLVDVLVAGILGHEKDRRTEPRGTSQREAVGWTEAQLCSGKGSDGKPDLVRSPPAKMRKLEREARRSNEFLQNSVEKFTAESVWTVDNEVGEERVAMTAAEVRGEMKQPDEAHDAGYRTEVPLVVEKFPTSQGPPKRKLFKRSELGTVLEEEESKRDHAICMLNEEDPSEIQSAQASRPNEDGVFLTDEMMEIELYAEAASVKEREKQDFHVQEIEAKLHQVALECNMNRNTAEVSQATGETDESGEQNSLPAGFGVDTVAADITKEEGIVSGHVIGMGKAEQKICQEASPAALGCVGDIPDTSPLENKREAETGESASEVSFDGTGDGNELSETPEPRSCGNPTTNSLDNPEGNGKDFAFVDKVAFLPLKSTSLDNDTREQEQQQDPEERFHVKKEIEGEECNNSQDDLLFNGTPSPLQSQHGTSSPTNEEPENLFLLPSQPQYKLYDVDAENTDSEEETDAHHLRWLNSMLTSQPQYSLYDTDPATRKSILKKPRDTDQKWRRLESGAAGAGSGRGGDQQVPRDKPGSLVLDAPRDEQGVAQRDKATGIHLRFVQTHLSHDTYIQHNVVRRTAFARFVFLFSGRVSSSWCFSCQQMMVFASLFRW